MAFDAPDNVLVHGISVRRLTYHRGAGETTVAPEHWLTLRVGAPAEDATCKGIQASSALDFVPAGTAWRWEDNDTSPRVLISITPDRLSRAAVSFREGLQVRARYRIHDPQLGHLVLALTCAAEALDLQDLQYLDRLSDLFLARLIAKVGDLRVERGAHQHLSVRQKRRVQEFIDAKFGERIHLKDIARVAGVGSSHFRVLFRRTFGTSVHQYLIQQRINRAIQLISVGGVSIADVAAACGFAHQSHMARCMRKVRGITPSILARARR